MTERIERERGRLPDKTTHLARIAREALSVSEGHFNHESGASVVRALLAHIEHGDPELIPTATANTLRNNLHWSGREARNVVEESRLFGSWALSNYGLGEILETPRVTDRISGSWIKTFQYASAVLPPGTTIEDLAYFLALFTDRGLSKITSVEERMRAVRRLRTRSLTKV